MKCSNKWIWFAKVNVVHYQNDSEPKKYPDEYEKYVPKSSYDELEKGFNILLEVVQKIASKELEQSAGMYEFLCEGALLRLKDDCHQIEKEMRALILAGKITGLQEAMRPLLNEWSKLNKELEAYNVTSTK